MVQEVQLREFRKIDGWEEWLGCWKKNNVQQLAISLLHIGPEVIGKGAGKRHDYKSRVEEIAKGIRFYLEVAQWKNIDQGSPFEPHIDVGDYMKKESTYYRPIQEIGGKASGVLVHEFLREKLDGLWQHPDKDLVMGEVLDYLAEPKNAEIYSEPYKSDLKRFVTDLWVSATRTVGNLPGRSTRFSSWKGILFERKESLIRALVNNKLFDQILEDNVLEAIPILKERIFQIVNGSLLPKEELPQEREAWMTELEDIKSRAFGVALDFGSAKKEAGTLLILITRRDVLSSRS